MDSSGDPAGTNTSGGNLLQIVLATTLAIFLGVFEEVADPFGLDTESDRLSANIYTTITSPLYGASTQVEITVVGEDGEPETKQYYSRKGQSKVMVLLITDDSFGKDKLSWPLPPRRYKRILRTLVDAGASAIFVDIYFNKSPAGRTDEIASLFRESQCLAVTSACRSVAEDWNCQDHLGNRPACDAADKQPGAAIFFAGTLEDPTPKANGMRPAASALAQMISDDNAYKLTQKAVNGQTYGTAAWELYKAWCIRDADCAAKTDPGEFQIEQMYLSWGYAPNEVMTGIEDFQFGDCQPQARTIPGRIWNSIRIFSWNFIRGFHEPAIAPCPYQSQLNVGLLGGLSAEELAQLFRGNIVLIGTSLKNFPDYHWSPVHDYVPGVFWHATAVDNLIEFSGDYMKKSESDGSDFLEPIGIIFIFLVQAWLTYTINRREEEENLEIKQRLKLDLLHGLFIIVTISAIVLWITGYMRWSPANWIGLAMLMFLIDLKPVTAVPKFCWNIFPITVITHQGISLVSNIIRAGFFIILLLLSGYLTFIVPHALLLAGSFSSTIICSIFISLYFGIALYCIWRIRPWRPS